jgi:hypothetical protein
MVVLWINVAAKLNVSLSWLGKYFFTGGIMPSDHLLLSFQDDPVLEDHWSVSGVHYHKTAETWLPIVDEIRAFADIVEETGAGCVKFKAIPLSVMALNFSSPLRTGTGKKKVEHPGKNS